MKRFILSLLLLTSIAHSHEPAAAAPKGSGLKVLVYSNTGYYRHPEIPKINRWLVLLGHENGFEVDVTEHAKDMRAQELSGYDVLVLNSANELDKVLPEEQRQAVEQWFASGKKGIVGLHAALVHQTKWPWLNALGGCDFNSDSDYAKAKVKHDLLKVELTLPEIQQIVEEISHQNQVVGVPTSWLKQVVIRTPLLRNLYHPLKKWVSIWRRIRR